MDTQYEEGFESTTSTQQERDIEYIPRISEKRHYPNQNELNDLIRDLGLTKSGGELLTSRLKEWNLLADDCRTTIQRSRHAPYSAFFDVDQDLCFCQNVNGLFNALQLYHYPNEWRLFIDSSTRSLKGVLLHNGNIYPSLPLAYSLQMKEDYKNVKHLLSSIKYTEYKWDICGDFKMIGFLLGLQGGYTKHSCFLCLWDSRADREHYTRVNWPPREDFQRGRYNVSNPPLVDAKKHFASFPPH